MQNLILPTDNFYGIYGESTSLFDVKISKRTDLGLIRAEVKQMKLRYESLLGGVEPQYKDLEEGYQIVRQKGESLEPAAVQVLEDVRNKIKDLKVKILFLDKTEKFYSDLIEAYRIDLSNHSAHLKRLVEITAKYR